MLVNAHWKNFIVVPEQDIAKAAMKYAEEIKENAQNAADADEVADAKADAVKSKQAAAAAEADAVHARQQAENLRTDAENARREAEDAKWRASRGW